MGQWGSLIPQFGVTIAVILILTGFVYWLVRRYSSGPLGRIGRGRVPRLAVIDAMAIDRRRRLLLIRRDNVEHLILVGGPADVVVEQSIQRPRQRPAARPQAAQAAPETLPTPEPLPPADAQPEASPIAAIRDTAFVEPAPAAVAASGSERLFFSSRRVVPPQVTRVERASAIAFDGRGLFMEGAESSPGSPDVDLNAMPRVADASAASYAPNGNGSGSYSEPNETARLASTEDVVGTDDAGTTVSKVNDLEREMARLLGEITVKRPA